MAGLEIILKKLAGDIGQEESGMADEKNLIISVKMVLAFDYFALARRHQSLGSDFCLIWLS